jgi:hypothetical protein
MSDGPDAFSSIVSTTELADGLALIFIAGPDFRAPEGLALIRARLPESRPTLWHRLDRDGPDVVSAIEHSGLKEPIVLVHGLENLDLPARADLEASMNMLRDRLVSARAIVILWVPRSDAESFQHHCADLFAWRSLFVSLTEPQVPIDPALEIRRGYLARLRARLERIILPARAFGQVRLEILSNRMVQPGRGMDEAVSLERWVRETKAGFLFGETGSGKTTALMALALGWAREAAMGGERDTPYPLLLGARELYIGPGQGLALGEQGLPKAEDLPDAQAEAWARQGNLVLLVDAIDEVEPPAQRLIIDWLEDVLARHPKLRATMTSRSLGIPRKSSWRLARLVPLTIRQLREQLEQLSPQQALGGQQQEVLDAVLECLELLPPQVAGISPLLVNLLYNVASTLGFTPTLPAELFDRVLSFLLEGQQGRRIGFPPLLLRRTLSRLAWWSLDNPYGEVNEEAFEYAVRTAQELETGGAWGSSSQEALQLFRGFADRITWIVAEVRPGLFRFTQPLFQSFLAAEWFATGGAERAFQKLEPYLNLVNWRTVVVLTAALLSRRGRRDFPLFVEKLLEGCLAPWLARDAKLRRVAVALDCTRASWIAYAPLEDVQHAALRLSSRSPDASDSSGDEAEREFHEAVRRALDELKKLRDR